MKNTIITLVMLVTVISGCGKGKNVIGEVKLLTPRDNRVWLRVELKDTTYTATIATILDNQEIILIRTRYGSDTNQVKSRIWYSTYQRNSIESQKIGLGSDDVLHRNKPTENVCITISTVLDSRGKETPRELAEIKFLNPHNGIFEYIIFLAPVKTLHKNKKIN